MINKWWRWKYKLWRCWVFLNLTCMQVVNKDENDKYMIKKNITIKDRSMNIKVLTHN